MNIKFFYQLFLLFWSLPLIFCANQIPALGRRARLGDLYDAKFGTFVDQNIFATTKNKETQIPPDFTASAYLQTLVYLTSSIADQRNALYKGPNLNFDQLIEVKSSLIRTRFGASAYLYEDDGGGRQSAKEVEGFIHQTVTTRNETLYGLLSPQRELEPYVNKETLHRTNATHIVVGIQFGGEFVLRFLDKNKGYEDYKDVETKLQTIFRTIIGEFESSSQENVAHYDLSDYFIKIYSDIGSFVLKSKPKSTIEVVEMISNFTDECERNHGELAVPILYDLFPIVGLKGLYGLQDVSQYVLWDFSKRAYEKILKAFEQISQVQLHLNDMKGQIDKYLCFVSKEEIDHLKIIQTGFQREAENLKENVRNAILNVRGGLQDPRIFNKLTREYNAKDFAAQKVHDVVIDQFEELLKRIESQPGHNCA